MFLPVDFVLLCRWMAPESIKYRRYSQKSDVYTFGMLLWEMWSSGMIPFPTIAADAQAAEEVMRGKRPERSPGCPEAAFKLMGKCWEVLPEKRPTFATLKTDIQDAYASVCGMPQVIDLEED
jgi:c-src tyrosine kinase